MASKSETKTPVTPVKTVLQTRVPADLARQVQQLAHKAGDPTPSDFIRRAIENEISRQTLCKPEPPITLSSLAERLEQMSHTIDLVQINHALLTSISQALGINPSGDIK